MSINDISNYNLEELRQAFGHVNDLRHPKRAEEVYLRLITVEKEQSRFEIKNREIKQQELKKNNAFSDNSIVIKTLRFLYYFILALFFRSNPVLVSFFENENQEVEAKVERIKARLSRSTDS